jgi:YLATT-like protein
MIAGFAVVSITMTLAGIAGGGATCISALLTDSDTPQSDNKNPPAIKKPNPLHYMAIGVIAAFTTPLILAIAQSSLLSAVLTGADSGTYGRDLFVFASICIVIAFSSRAFLNNLSGYILASVQNAKNTAYSANEKASEATTIASDANEKSENALLKPEPIVADRSPDYENLTENEKLIIESFRKRKYPYRTLYGIEKDSGLSRQNVDEGIEKLEARRIIVARSSDETGNTLYALVPDQGDRPSE